MLNLFAGYDKRESPGFHVFAHSVISRATVPVAITPLAAMGLPEGTNNFTLSRFLIPSLMQFKGRAIFADGCDMLMMEDIAELDDLFDPDYAVQVVKHPNYTSSHQRKYVGTEMEADNRDYEFKNWASLMLIRCDHPTWKEIDPAADRPLNLLQFERMAPGDIGSLPPEWNVLADEGQNLEDAKVLHWTAGVPAFPYYKDAPGAEHWHAARAEMESIHG